MTDKKLFRTGCTGTVVAALCCFTPVLAIGLGAIGLSAWLGWIDYVLFPVMFASLGIVAYSLYLRADSPGVSPKATIAVLVVALSALMFWLEFRYALRISIGAMLIVAVYGIYLHKTSSRPGPDIESKEQI